MGFLRKATFLATGGTSGLFIKANSKKERSAKALEQQVKLQKAQAKAEARNHRSTSTPPPASDSTTPLIADELAKLVELRDSGVLSEAEFTAQKAKLLGS